MHININTHKCSWQCRFTEVTVTSTACQHLTWLSARQMGQKTRNGTEQNVRWLLYQLISRLCDISGLSFSFSLSLSLSLTEWGCLGRGGSVSEGGLSVCVCEGTDGSVVMWCVSRGMFDGLMLSSSIAMYHLISLPPSASIKPAWLLISASLSVSPLSVCLSFFLSLSLLYLFLLSAASAAGQELSSAEQVNFLFFQQRKRVCVCTVAGTQTHTHRIVPPDIFLLLRALHFSFI